MNSNGKFLIGLLTGLGVGTLVGLLIAPEKGSETYKKLEGAVKDAANDIMKTGNDLISSASEGAREGAEAARRKAETNRN
jgi:gas vesicle protein